VDLHPSQKSWEEGFPPTGILSGEPCQYALVVFAGNKFYSFQRDYLECYFMVADLSHQFVVEGPLKALPDQQAVDLFPGSDSLNDRLRP
jgi:hypothetical protein